MAATGNQTIACERARVSQSRVTLHRSTDPAFRAELDAAIATARASLAERRTNGGGTRPAAGWQSIDGEELVVRGTNGRRTQIARARLKQWTPRVEARFLAALAAMCNVRTACGAVGLSVPSAYQHYHRWDGFAKRWNAALAMGYDRLEMALVETACRSLDGAPDPAPDIPIRPMTFDDAFRLLRLHAGRVRGGRVVGPASPDEVMRELMKRVAAKRRALLGEAAADGEAARAASGSAGAASPNQSVRKDSGEEGKLVD